MKLFEVTNGSMGESYVKVFVIAEVEQVALELAEIRYKKEGSSCDNLTAEVICGDTSRIWVSEMRDY
jgi:hypothetical protein